jgi:septal ring factor EnvC (AmiA/AmiB activator)
VKEGLANLQKELTKLKKEMRKFWVQKGAIADERHRHEQEICDVKHDVELLPQTSNSQWESHE